MEESSQPEPAQDVHKPFTKAERMQQLSEIDYDITKLLTLTSDALKVLTKPDSTTPNGQGDNGAAAAPEKSPEEQTAAFKQSMDAFLLTLHSVDVRLKRQIMGLEEAGIISLKENKGQASLEPNGIGNIGNLDVGWLNSRSNKVERDMEAELWERAKEHLEGISSSTDGQESSTKDIKMEG
ncbi:uncharacterized protein E0L32_009793 [Thyridium curvatum]|uniref:Mediator of RNA polymerase II transcription subunit 11 n=1 Tax=Thyridium curvatum TaxID=1093900 RepID=A0A507AUZ8_9PEZI|nr:uncharacterized protein E0L32_009793 [Thyridium curvatum]TPX08731.1 hypothetical protein E0L32_009793 [Thyridium curvatum]